MDAGPRSIDIPFLDGHMFKQVIMSCTRDIVIHFVNFFKGMELHPHLIRSLIVWMDLLMSPMCSFAAHGCR